jgi:hypothetical protein
MNCGSACEAKGAWCRCILCTRIRIGRSYWREENCDCTSSVKFYELPGNSTGGRVSHALREAQRARFEHGENGRPRPFVPAKLPDIDVYVSGSVIEEVPDTTILHQHGIADNTLAEDCIKEVEEADVMFAWVDRTDTIGTLVEIGAARVYRTPIFIAFATEALADRFYFARQLATVSLVTSDAVAAWCYFKNWQDQYP